MSCFNNPHEHKYLAKRFRDASPYCQQNKDSDLLNSSIAEDNVRLEELKFGYFICDADSSEEANHDLETFFKARSTQEFYSLILAQFPEDPIFCLNLVGHYTRQALLHRDSEDLRETYQSWVNS